jgi:DNA invertase Pin-like site-specific DNA recombinase
MKAIILARESDKNQDSNDAQLSRIQEYAKGKGLEEWKVLKLKESSTKGYRTKLQRVRCFRRASQGRKSRDTFLSRKSCHYQKVQ